MDTVCCPVCTLYLREGVTLQEHLDIHPKEEVIEALVRYSGVYNSNSPLQLEGQVQSKHYQEFVSGTAFPRAAATTMVYPVYPQGSVVRPPYLGNESADAADAADVVPVIPVISLPAQSKGSCGADCDSCSHYAPHKVEPQRLENVYETTESAEQLEDSTQKIWTPVSEEPTNLCLRQNVSPAAHQDHAPRPPWVPQFQTEIAEMYPARHVRGGGTIVEAGEGRTLLNLSEPGPMSVLELEGIHFLVPAQFVGNAPAGVPAGVAPQLQLVRPSIPSSSGGVGVPVSAPPPPPPPTFPPTFPPPPPPYPKRALSPDMDIAESPCSAADSAPPSPLIKRAESPINIRSDETMPAHGEISEQESVGGNSSSMWPDQNFSLKERTAFTDVEEASDSATRFIPQSFSSTLPACSPLLEPLNPLDTASAKPPEKKPARVPKCRWCQMTFSRQAERRAHICDKRSTKSTVPVAEPSTSETVMQVQKPKRVYKRKPKDAPVETANDQFKLEQFADVVVSKFQDEKEEKKVGATEKIKCEKCDEEFSSYRLVASHRVREHKGSRYECSTCSETFEFEAQYHGHLRVHPLECKLCGKFFYRRKNMALHMKRHMSDKPYKCQHCEKAFVTKQKLDEHSNIHTGNAPIKCPLCEETFRRYSNLVQHKNRHHLNIERKKKDFICHCGEVYHTKKKLEWHKEIHAEKPKSCSFCNERFVHSSSLTRHVRKAHDERYVPKVGREVENVECPICHAVCLKSSLPVHMRTHSGARPFPCHICGKNFTTKWNLQLHRWTHASRSTKPFKCSMCKSAFYRRSDFTSHMRSHRNVRPYTCNHCGCQFIRKYNCIRHMNEHEKSKPYSCTICDKTFHRSYYLKEHMRVHSKTRPYSCHICGKASSSKSNHNKHVKIHHAREPQNTEG